MKVYHIIRQNKDQILKRWLTAVKQQVVGAQGQTTPALRNDVPDLLEEIITILDEETEQESLHESVDHGRLRATIDGYTLSHVIREYRLLLQVIFETIDQVSTIQPVERNKIISTITSAIEHASQAFYEIRQDEEIKAKQEAEATVEELREEAQLRDDFIGTVTHDLRNPLANTMALLELLKSKLSSEPFFENHLAAIQVSINQADTLIRNLLDVNLIQSGGQLPIHLQHCNLLEEVRASVAEFTEQYAGDIQVECEQLSLEGDYDCQAIRRAVDNLIHNAIKYGDHKSIITLTCRRLDDYTEIAVHNYGNPIPIHQQAKIFSRYYQVEENSHKRGWGIGLSLVKGIVEAHGGKVDLVSSTDEGTTFSIKIPNVVQK